MCEYDEACTKPVDPVAKALSENPRPNDADLRVFCPAPHHHLLAAVYDVPGKGRMLCTPHFKWRAGSLFKPSSTLDPNEEFHMHPALERLADLDLDETEYGRCHCGTWNYSVRQIVVMLQAHDEGRILPSGDLVKVRHESGQVTRMGRAHAESHGLEIIGSVVRNARLAGPKIIASFVAMADAPTGH